MIIDLDKFGKSIILPFQTEMEKVLYKLGKKDEEIKELSDKLDKLENMSEEISKRLDLGLDRIMNALSKERC